ncbi:MAG: tetratricopeptide repeat protein [Bacteroidota bacterium]
MKFYFVLFLLMCLNSYLRTQSNSIQKILSSTGSDEKSIKMLLDSAKEIEFINPELAEKYTAKVIMLSKKNNDKLLEADAYTYLGLLSEDISDFEKAATYFNKALKIFEDTKDKKRIAGVFNNLGSMYEYLGMHDTSLYFYNKSIPLNKETGNELGYGDNLYNMGLIYYTKGNNDLAMTNWFESLKIFEKLKDYEGMGACQHMIGLVLRSQKKYDKSLGMFENAYQSGLKSKDDRLTADILLSIGNVYVETENYEKALQKFRESKNLFLRSGDNFGIASVMTNMGDIFKIKDQIDSAIVYYRNSHEIFQEYNIPSGIVHTFAELAECNYLLKQYPEAIKYCNLSLEQAVIINSNSYKAMIYMLFYKIYYKLNDTGKALEFHVKYAEINDSLFNENKEKIVEELQTKYETEKKEQQIQLQKTDIEKKEALISKERFQKYGISAIGFLFILLSLVIFRSYRHKKEANIQLSLQNEQIKQQKEEIQAQRDLAAAQRDLIADQKQDITDSIQYAYKIQSAIFPAPEEIILFLKDYFILYKPRDIVSGDFYWINKLDKKIIIIAADCTGHGVPGAFMSMLGFAFLNEIVNKERITSPSRILDRLRENIILALKQHGNLSEQRDGMDVAAITIDMDNLQMEYSGANNPLYMIRNNELIETKADKMPVSVYPKMNPFSNFSSQLNKNDVIYIFSDGFADQFGGKSGKKYKYSKFKELLMSINDKPMKEQEMILNNSFEDWKGNFDQIDDVLVIGIKI